MSVNFRNTSFFSQFWYPCPHSVTPWHVYDDTHTTTPYNMQPCGYHHHCLPLLKHFCITLHFLLPCEPSLLLSTLQLQIFIDPTKIAILILIFGLLQKGGKLAATAKFRSVSCRLSLRHVSHSVSPRNRHHRHTV